MIQEVKTHYLKTFLNHNSSPVEIYRRTIIKAVKIKIREFYLSIIKKFKEKLINIMLIHTVFLIKLFKKYENNFQSGNFHRIYKIISMHVMNYIRKVLLMLRNQIIFFVMKCLYYIQKDENFQAIIKLKFFYDQFWD